MNFFFWRFFVGTLSKWSFAVVMKKREKTISDKYDHFNGILLPTGSWRIRAQCAYYRKSKQSFFSFSISIRFVDLLLKVFFCFFFSLAKRRSNYYFDFFILNRDYGNVSMWLCCFCFISFLYIFFFVVSLLLFCWFFVVFSSFLLRAKAIFFAYTVTAYKSHIVRKILFSTAIFASTSEIQQARNDCLFFFG